MGFAQKSLMALLLACLVALAPAALIGWQLLDGVRDHFGRAFADNFTQLNRQRILAPVSRELALSLRLADSEVTRRWLRNESDPARELFFREADGYRRDLLGRAYFIASAATGNYYFNDDQPLSEAPRYTLSRGAADDGWFYKSLQASALYNINVNPDLKLKTTRVWINAQVRDGDKVLGLTGAGLDVGGFLRDFVNSGQAGVTPIIVDETGAIQAHMDPTLIAYNSGAGGADGRGMVFSLLDPGPGARNCARPCTRRRPIHSRCSRPGSVDGHRQLVSVAYMPELHWHVLTLVDLGAAGAGHGLDLAGGGGPGAAVRGHAAVLRLRRRAVDAAALRRLQQSARAIANGSYDVSLPPGGQDEIGDLSNAFGVMADKVRQHTAELEQGARAHLGAGKRQPRHGRRAQEDRRLHRLRQPDPAGHPAGSPADPVAGRASLRAVEAARRGGRRFYVFRSDGGNCLLGIMDCAGHGVPGALMTMLARAAIDLAITEVGPSDPAAVLTRTDSAIRAMLADAQLPRALATNTDAGWYILTARLACCATRARRSACTPAMAMRCAKFPEESVRWVINARASTRISSCRWNRAGPTPWRPTASWIRRAVNMASASATRASPTCSRPTRGGR